MVAVNNILYGLHGDIYHTENFTYLAKCSCGRQIYDFNDKFEVNIPL
jgi:hypothetical protein